MSRFYNSTDADPRIHQSIEKRSQHIAEQTEYLGETMPDIAQSADELVTFLKTLNLAQQEFVLSRFSDVIGAFAFEVHLQKL